MVEECNPHRSARILPAEHLLAPCIEPRPTGRGFFLYARGQGDCLQSGSSETDFVVVATQYRRDLDSQGTMIVEGGTAMAITLDLDPQFEERLRAEAARLGQEPGEYVKAMVEQQVGFLGAAPPPQRAIVAGR